MLSIVINEYFQSPSKTKYSNLKVSPEAGPCTSHTHGTSNEFPLTDDIDIQNLWTS